MSGKRGNGEGSIYKRKDGMWCGVVTNGRETDGKLKRVYYYGKTRTEIAEKIVKAQNEIKTGVFIEPTKMKVSEWMDIWMQEYMKSKLRPTTYGSYEYLARIHIKPQIGEMLLKELRPEHLQKMYNEKYANGRHDEEGGLSPRSVRYIHIVIHGALEQAVRNNLLARNVSEATTLP